MIKAVSLPVCSNHVTSLVIQQSHFVDLTVAVLPIALYRRTVESLAFFIADVALLEVLVHIVSLKENEMYDIMISVSIQHVFDRLLT